MRGSKVLSGFLAALVCAACPTALSAEEGEGAGGVLTLELNALQAAQEGCRVTFVVTNGLDAEIDRAAYELAFFDERGLISRLTVVDFLELPKGKAKVRQFAFPDMACEAVGRILVNDVAECSGSGLARDACMRRLATDNKTAIQFGT